MVLLPVPAGPTSTSSGRPEVAIFSTASGLIDAHGVVPAGQVLVGDGRHRGDRDRRAFRVSAGGEEPLLGVEQARGRVEVVVRGRSRDDPSARR